MPQTKVKVSLMQMPYSLGFVGPAAKNASVAITANVLPVEQDGKTQRDGFAVLVIQSHPGNTGNYIYILNNSSAPDTSAGSNVIAVLQPGDYWPRDRQWSNTIRLANFFIGIDNSTGAVAADVAVVSIMEF
jgi:hypothetical protein